MNLSIFFNRYPHLREKILSSNTELDSYGYPVNLTLELIRSMKHRVGRNAAYSSQKRFSFLLLLDDFVPLLFMYGFLWALLGVSIFILASISWTEYNESELSPAFFICCLLLIVFVSFSGFLLRINFQYLKDLFLNRSKYHYWDEETIYSKTQIHELYNRNIFKSLDKSREDLETTILNIPRILYIKCIFDHWEEIIKTNLVENKVFHGFYNYHFCLFEVEDLLNLCFKETIKENVMHEDMHYRTLLFWKILFYQTMYLKLLKFYGKNHHESNLFFSQMQSVKFTDENFELPTNVDVLSLEMIDFVFNKTSDKTLKNTILQYLDAQ